MKVKEKTNGNSFQKQKKRIVNEVKNFRFSVRVQGS